MAWRYILGLLVIPLLDASLLVALAIWTPFGLGAVALVALVVITALLGLVFVRAEARRTLGKFRRSLSRGEPPTDELIDGALLVAAGAFLLTPGFVTDLVAALLIVPPTRYPVRVVVRRYVLTPYLDEKTDGFATGGVYRGGFPDENEPDEDYVDVDFEER